MHDLDSTKLESNLADFDEDDELEYDIYDDDEFDDEDDDDDDNEYSMEAEFEFDNPFNEADEMELAAELMMINNDAEMEQFLGKIFKKVVKNLPVARAIKFGKRFLKSKGGRFLRKRLRKLARRALPWAGRAVGGYFGGPAGAALGGRGASFLGKRFGLELEGLSSEDQEMEVARRFVRLAGDAMKNTAEDEFNLNSISNAKRALTTATKKHTPGLLRSGLSRAISKAGGRSGRWFRKGNSIVLIGA